MNHPLMALALADVRRDEMTALARRCREPRTPHRAWLLRGLGLRPGIGEDVRKREQDLRVETV